MTRWTKDKLFRRRLNQNLDTMDYEDAVKKAAEQAEEDFSELCDREYDRMRDDRLDRNQ